MAFSFNEIKLKALFVFGMIILFAFIYRDCTDASDWNHHWRPNIVDNMFFSLGTTATAGTADISPVSTKAKILVMLQMIMVVVIILWDL